MITRIKRVSNFGVFDNYTVPSDLLNFGRYNIIYGENGSGKTTLSRLFSCLEAGVHKDYPGLKFEIESNSGYLTNGKQCPYKIRVFNSDYIEANIGHFDGPIRHILILGEENKILAEELKAETIDFENRQQKIRKCEKEIEKLNSEKGKKFTEIAKTISEATSGLISRSYRKPEAESAFAKLTAASQPLSDEDLELHRKIIRQELMEHIEPIIIKKILMEDGTIVDPIELSNKIAEESRQLIKRSAQSSVIERLTQNPSISTWVEEGFHLHKNNESNHCIFCNQTLPTNLLQVLANHFSAEDQNLKKDIELNRIHINKIIDFFNKLSLKDRMIFYSELRSEYDDETRSFMGAIAKLRTDLKIIDNILVEKLVLRNMVYEKNIELNTKTVIYSISRIESIIARHNDKNKKFNEEKSASRNLIEVHYLVSIKDLVEEISANIEEVQNEINSLRNGGEGIRSLDELKQSIRDKQEKISGTHAAGARITDHLKRFLGRTDLCFESHEDGYHIFRHGKPAKRLSEGEKTAIAFLHFLTRLRDKDFDLAEGIVVIDDPISSLDASSIYQAFSFLKNEVKDAKQIFILTHNFDFLRILINWISNVPVVKKADKIFMMLLCTENEHGRSARLEQLDNLLIKHQTEYQYLFKLLYNFQSDGTIANCYHIPNIARKVLDVFLEFHTPSNKSSYQKLETTNFDEHKKTAIYKFCNDLSHHTGKSFNPALISETRKCVKFLLEMIETLEPLHYKGLESLSS